MYVILVYDVGVERVNKVRKFLREYLNWMQNSVFEGELTKAEYRIVCDRLKSLIEKDSDSVRIYRLKSEKYLVSVELGKSRVEVSEII